MPISVGILSLAIMAPTIMVSTIQYSDVAPYSSMIVFLILILTASGPAPRAQCLRTLRWASISRVIRVFPEGWNAEAARLGACSVAAPIKDLLALAQSGVTVQYAAIVLTRGLHSGLSESDRDRLWKAFGVPVFEQCLGVDNELLAMDFCTSPVRKKNVLFLAMGPPKENPY